MCHEEEIDQRVKGTQYAAMIDRQAPAQRSGVLGSLNMVADSLKLLPSENEASGRVERGGMVESSARVGCSSRARPKRANGFCRSRVCGSTRLVLRLMNQGTDQFAQGVVCFGRTGDACSGCRNCIRRSRRTANPTIRLCLASRDAASLKRATGMKRRPCCRSPRRKFSCAPASAMQRNGFRDTIGEVEIERLRESRSSGQMGRQRNSKSYNLEREVEPLVMDSEISGLENLHGYLKSGNLVVRMSFPFIELPSKASEVHPATDGDPPEEPPRQQRPRREQAAGRNRNSRSTKSSKTANRN